MLSSGSPFFGGYRNTVFEAGDSGIKHCRNDRSGRLRDAGSKNRRNDIFGSLVARNK